MDSGKVFPAAWALLPGKGAPVYKRMWKAIEEVKIKERHIYSCIISIYQLHLFNFLHL